MKYNCAYIRLSDEDIKKSNDFSESVFNQVELIEEFAKNNNIRIDKKFIDDGYSGINFHRPAFESMLKEIEQGHIETIITKDFSRLGREYIETSFYIMRYLPEHGIRYIAINENYDSHKKDNEFQDVLIGIKSIMNDRYIKEASQKIKTVKAPKIEDGNYMGFIAPYGYKKIKDVDGRITLKVDENVSSVVRFIFCCIIDGKSREETAEKLNNKKILTPMQYLKMTKSRGKNYYDKWNDKIIYKIIRNIIYTGNTYKRKSVKNDYRQKKREYIKPNDREINYNTHPAIVTQDEFDQANKMIKTNKVKKNRLKDYKGILDGIVRCGECGKIMNVSGRKKEYGKVVYCFYCTDGKNKNKQCKNSRIIYTNKLEQIVYEYISNELRNTAEKNIIEKSNEYLKNIRNLRNKIELCKKEIEMKKIHIKNLYLQKVDNKITIDEFIQKRKVIDEEINELEKLIIELTKNIDEKIKDEEIVKKYNEFKKENNLMKYIKELVKEINFYENRKIEIKLTFNG